MVSLSDEQLLHVMKKPHTYRHSVNEPVTVLETHISWIFLAGDFAYKIKKPIVTGFLDYSTLAKREKFCHEEVRLNTRYADGLYLGVSSINLAANDFSADRVSVDGPGTAVEYAVRMQRFPQTDVLSNWIVNSLPSIADIRQLAGSLAAVHRQAATISKSGTFGSPEHILADALDNLQDPRFAATGHAHREHDTLLNWTRCYFEQHRDTFERRLAEGWVRECHGDLHLSNIVRWKGRWVPFDGIEFNDEFRWIDVLNDAAFLAMDFAACGYRDLSHSFISAYLENTGDYHNLELWSWYMVYRTLVRSKVAAIRLSQLESGSDAWQETMDDFDEHIRLALEFTQPRQRFLWITHGLSGSGKTTGSEWVIQQTGAIRIRSDVERKRLHGKPATHRPGNTETSNLYSVTSSRDTYLRLQELSRAVLRSGLPVVVDAAFLRAEDRDAFRTLAATEGLDFRILHFDASPDELRRRLTARRIQGTDASDAGIEVLEQQLLAQEPLTDDELRFTIERPLDQPH